MEPARQRLLFLTTDLPYPQNSGGRIKTFRLLSYLAQHYDVSLITAYGGDRKQDIAAFRNLVPLKGFQAFRHHLPRTRFHFLKALMTAPTFNSYRIRNEEIVAMVKWSAEASDIVLVDHLECVDLMPEKFLGNMVYHSHNAEYKLWRESAAYRSNGLTKWLLHLEANRVSKLEKYAIAHARFSFFSPNDQASIQSIWKFSDDAFRSTYHLGNDAFLKLDAPALEKAEIRVFYGGTLSWEPNRDGLVWFLRTSWPMIRQSVPEAEFHVCGGGASEELRRILRQTEGVVYHGFVEDLDDVMNTCSCAVVPLRFGAGMKIKTLDAMYRGLPLIATSVAVEGLEVENNVHASIVNEADAFGNAVIELLHDSTKATTLRDRARALCTEHYVYSKLLPQMHSELKNL